MRNYSKKNYLRHKDEVEEFVKLRPDNLDFNSATTNEILAYYIHLVHGLVKSFSLEEKASGVLNLEDITQEGYIGLIEGVNKLDLDTLSKADNPQAMANDFLRRRIWGAIRRGIYNGRGQMKMGEYAIREANKGKKKHFVAAFFNAVFEYLSEVKGVYSKFYLQIEDKKLEYDADFVNRYLVGLINKYLDIDESTSIKMFYGIGCDPENRIEIGKKIGVASTKVDEVIFRGVNKLKDKVDPDYVSGFMNN